MQRGRMGCILGDEIVRSRSHSPSCANPPRRSPLSFRVVVRYAQRFGDAGEPRSVVDNPVQGERPSYFQRVPLHGIPSHWRWRRHHILQAAPSECQTNRPISNRYLTGLELGAFLNNQVTKPDHVRICLDDGSEVLICVDKARVFVHSLLGNEVRVMSECI